jgi:hypothetical protein
MPWLIIMHASYPGGEEVEGGEPAASCAVGVTQAVEELVHGLLAEAAALGPRPVPQVLRLCVRVWGKT